MAVFDPAQFYAAPLLLEAVVFVSIMAAEHAAERLNVPNMLSMGATV